MLTVTLQQIKDAEPCLSGWAKVLKANGGVNADMQKPFPLASILDSNDLDDTLWVVANVPELSNHDDIWRKFACWCALQNVGKITNRIEKESWSLIVNWLETNNPDLRDPAWNAAESVRSAAESSRAVRSAADPDWSTAESAARYAAESAWSVAESAKSVRSDRSAAWASSWSAARSAQAEKLRELLGE